MSQKRKHAELAEGDSRQTQSFKKSRQPFRPGGPYNKFKGSKRKDASEVDAGNSIGKLKSRIRDLKRLLEHVDNEPKYKMPAGVRVERERELETCEHELAEKTSAAREAELRKRMIGKYHQVRFFDRQKATRILKRLKKELSSLEDRSKRAELLQKIHNAEVDVNYAIYYPLSKPYSSLYPKSKREKNKSDRADDEDQDSAKMDIDWVNETRGDPEMWREIEQAMEEDTLDVLRNSKSSAVAAEPKEDKKAKDKKMKKDKKKQQASVMHQMLNETKTAATQEEDEDSDGGFFE